MSENKAKMKEVLSQFVDSLMDDEIKELHAGIRGVKTEVLNSISSFKEEFEKELSQVKRELMQEATRGKEDVMILKKELAQLKSMNSEIINEKIDSMAKTIENKSSLIDTRVGHISEELDNKLREYVSDTNLQIRDLAKRVTQAEKVTHLFGNFAADYSSILGKKQDTPDKKEHSQQYQNTRKKQTTSVKEKQQKSPSPSVAPKGKVPKKSSPKPPVQDESPLELDEFEKNFIENIQPRDARSRPTQEVPLASSSKKPDDSMNQIITDDNGQQLYVP
ncbi:hypothetical protein [Chitinivibrio alkaliphilus]|uniref:Uncharacterized protein n=1 Tax=Chitinivibrio alkaliphilus ACht1 TaxID=1313304 RepID=U7DCM1_9BACT|nr:hypothetical protein [Chitinivibrio alkaliphilus]ERP39298.1 hypothetical protein CALK_0091 [Chitinivibrio alkaliphilus ACht1]